MTLYDFIFTKKMPGRLLRHIAFWLAQFVFWIFWAAGLFYNFNWEFIKFQFQLHEYFALDISFTYFVVYYLSPKYLIRKKFFKFSISIFIFTILTYLLYISYRFWLDDMIKASRDNQLLTSWYFSMNFIIHGPPVICAMFFTFKMFKNYYIKMQEKITLTKENANAELQLLKAQVHPHFLFNTLNNIYSFALIKSPKAGSLLLKLSDTIRYMLNECEAAFVPLEKEIKMIENYIGLEKVRYGNRLNMEIEIKGNYQNKFIAPLLLIPFVENSFKHGASKILKHPLIKMDIEIKEGSLLFNLKNSKPLKANVVNGNNGIGLRNVQKILELLYPHQHELKINSTDYEYSIYMKIPLLNGQLITNAEEIAKEFKYPETFSYA